MDLSDDRRRRAIVIGGAVLVIAIALSELVPEARRGPQGPSSSSYATSPAGVAAWARLLQRDGHPVTRLRRQPADVTLDPRTTLVLLDPPEAHAATARALARFVRAGGRLVVAGREAGQIAGIALGARLRWAPRGARSWRVAAGVRRGRLVALADAGPLRNRLLGRGDDAAFALALVGARRRRVVFAESIHGYLESGGLGAVPDA